MGLSVLLWHNQSKLDSSAYGEDRIIKKSELFSRQIDVTAGTYSETYLELHQLADYTDYLQLGQHDEVEFYHTSFGETHPSW